MIADVSGNFVLVAPDGVYDLSPAAIAIAPGEFEPVPFGSLGLAGIAGGGGVSLTAPGSPGTTDYDS